MKEFLGCVGFGLMIIIIFKGCNAPIGTPLVGCHGNLWDTCTKEKSNG